MPPRQRSRPLRRFIGDRRGATALEFALIGGPLLFLIMVAFELGLIYMVTTSLDTATQEAARTIRTGQTQSGSGATATTFATLVCNNMGWLQSQCPGALSVDVRTFSSFAGQSAPAPVTSGKFDSTKLVFNTGSPGQIVLVRCFYRWNLLIPGLFSAIQTYSGVSLITAATTFRNEPF